MGGSFYGSNPKAAKKEEYKWRGRGFWYYSGTPYWWQEVFGPSSNDYYRNPLPGDSIWGLLSEYAYRDFSDDWIEMEDWEARWHTYQLQAKAFWREEWPPLIQNCGVKDKNMGDIIRDYIDIGDYNDWLSFAPDYVVVAKT